MEPENRPYVDSKTQPGDAGTEEWADTPPGTVDPVGHRPLTPPDAGTVDGDGVVDGSPADKFINDPDVIGIRKHEDDRA